MEKFSAFRDPGTGIQPFLTPVPPNGSDAIALILKPFGYTAGVIRTLVIVVLGLLYVVLDGLCGLLASIPPLHRALTHISTAIICRLVLLFAGLLWIPVETVTRKRGRVGASKSERWNPKAGDVIVSNWASWIELLWLACRFNPTFILPVCAPVNTESTPSTPLSVTPGRRTGTGSAAISSPSTRKPTSRAKVLGFRKVSLFGMLAAAGHVPGEYSKDSEYSSFETIRQATDRPVVVFPECTTSNGRGLLRFADVFVGIEVPVKKFKIFVMCVRYDPPTTLCPTLTHSVPSATLNPLSHIFALTTCLVPLTVSIRLLSPSESPSSSSFLESEFSSGGVEDVLTEACAQLIAKLGKMKRVGLGWEDKTAFLQFYKGKKK